MQSGFKTETIGVLASGGLDSSILIGHLLAQGRPVQPFYIRTGLRWQSAELPALTRFLTAIATNDLQKLVVLDLPLADLYDGHWSMTGDNVPAADSPDEAGAPVSDAAGEGHAARAGPASGASVGIACGSPATAAADGSSAPLHAGAPAPRLVNRRAGAPPDQAGIIVASASLANGR